jgi:anti-sigma regulatory factor (Ser/Thr protein kinase)
VVAVERLEVRLPAEPSSVPVLRGEAREYARAAGLPDEAVGMVALAVTEAATNAVVHAFVGRDPGHVELHAEPGDGELVLRIRDDGRGLTPRHDSPGLGLGLPTIGRCCTHLDLAEGPGGVGTEVRMCFDAPHLGLDADERLRRRIEATFGAVTEAITVNAPDGRVIYVNDAAAEILGEGDPATYLGAPPGELASRFHSTHEDGRVVVLDDFPHRAVLRGEQPAPLLTRSVHIASGRARWILTSARPLEDEVGTLAVNTILDVTEQKERERRARFLAQAAEVLASSLDLAETFQHIADLAVPALADWCQVSIADGDGILRRVALKHVDPAKIAIAEDYDRRWPADPSSDQGAYGVLKSGEPFFLPELPDELLAQSVPEPERLAVLRDLGMRSVLLLPMTGRDRVLGVLSLITAESHRQLEQADVDLAADVARRAGVAIDTARRFADRGA